MDYLDWSYESESEGRVDVKFSAKSNKVISVFCYSQPGNQCPSLNGIAPTMSEEEVLQRLGEPTQGGVEKAFGYVKRMKYPQYHVIYYLSKRQVYALELGERDETDASKDPAL